MASANMRRTSPPAFRINSAKGQALLVAGSFSVRFVAAQLGFKPRPRWPTKPTP